MPSKRDSQPHAEPDAADQPTERFSYPAAIVEESARSDDAAKTDEYAGRDAGEFDGRTTDEYEGAPTRIEPAPAAALRPAEPEPDPEDKETELWGSSARAIFPGEARRAPASLPASLPEPPPLPDQTPATPLPVDDEEGPQPARQPSRAGTGTANEQSVRAEPEEQDTEVVSGEFLARPQPARAAIDTEEHAAAEAEAARLLSESVEVSGEEGVAARRLAEAERRRAVDDSNATLVVERVDLPMPDRECRLCGRRISAPRRVRLRGSLQSDLGFRCETCSNDFCASHVKRVSGLFESLFVGARFRCLLCSPEALPKAPRGA